MEPGEVYSRIAARRAAGPSQCTALCGTEGQRGQWGRGGAVMGQRGDGEMGRWGDKVMGSLPGLLGCGFHAHPLIWGAPTMLFDSERERGANLISTAD